MKMGVALFVGGWLLATVIGVELPRVVLQSSQADEKPALPQPTSRRENSKAGRSASMTDCWESRRMGPSERKHCGFSKRSSSRSKRLSQKIA